MRRIEQMVFRRIKPSTLLAFLAFCCGASALRPIESSTEGPTIPPPGFNCAVVDLQLIYDSFNEVSREMYGSFAELSNRVLANLGDAESVTAYFKRVCRDHLNDAVRKVAERKVVDIVFTTRSEPEYDGCGIVIQLPRPGVPLYHSDRVDLTQEIVAEFRTSVKRALRTNFDPTVDKK